MIANKKDGFNTEPLVYEIENVIRNGLKQILNEYIDRYDLLEKTHQQIMRLPSVLNELNINPNTDAVTKIDNSELSTINSKISTIEKKYDLLNSTLDKILQKLDTLNDDVKNVKQNNDHQTKLIDLQCIKPSIVSACENENIKFVIIDCEDDEKKLDLKIPEVEEEEEEEEEEEVEEEEVEEEEVEEEEVEEEEVEDKEEDDEVQTELKVEVEVVEENVCSDCGCKVVSKEYITVVDGKNFCGACKPKDDDIETENSESEDDDKEDEEEEELVEIEIDDITYCTNDEENGFIYELTKDGDVGDKVGYLKEGEPFFYADEK